MKTRPGHIKIEINNVFKINIIYKWSHGKLYGIIFTTIEHVSPSNSYCFNACRQYTFEGFFKCPLL